MEMHCGLSGGETAIRHGIGAVVLAGAFLISHTIYIFRLSFEWYFYLQRTGIRHTYICNLGMDSADWWVRIWASGTAMIKAPPASSIILIMIDILNIGYLKRSTSS